ncbi:general substrate transporter [Lophiotrema nucula]|uniref:General substrate transporter n=1 Tax=Lophiotrema nucula TaxID=690887 RepID=A0A6A5ZMJ8_9PLEO|nr:general substrate transporter [Lophiotrema nucula]
MRNAMYASVCVMVAQQACGINIFAFLSATAFEKRLNKDNRKSLEYTIYFALANHIFIWVAIPLIDRNGRRWLLHYSFLGMAGCLAVIAGCANIKNGNTRERVLLAFTVLFTAVFSIGEGPSAFLVSCEAFPLIVRELGMSHAVFWNFAGAGVISFLIPIMDSKMDDSWFWALFIFFNLLFWRLSQFFVRETQGFPLEHIDETYSTSKLDHEENEGMVEVRIWKRIAKR